MSRTMADLERTIADQERVLELADRLAAEHGELLTLVGSHVPTIKGMADRIARFQDQLAAEGKHQLVILSELRMTLVAVAHSLEEKL